MKNKNQKVFETLIHHEHFLSECQKSRETYLQSKNEITLPRIGKLELEGGNEKVLLDETQRIMNMFPRLSRVWEKSVKRFIQTGNLEMPSDKPPFIVYKQHLDDNGNVLRKDLYLQIFKSTTQKDYQDWWKEIEKYQNWLDEANPKPITDRDLEILKLHNQGKKDTEIADILFEKGIEINESYIRKIISELSKQLGVTKKTIKKQ